MYAEIEINTKKNITAMDGNPCNRLKSLGLGSTVDRVQVLIVQKRIVSQIHIIKIK
jgi:hypothetical protein